MAVPICHRQNPNGRHHNPNPPRFDLGGLIAIAYSLGMETTTSSNQ